MIFSRQKANKATGGVLLVTLLICAILGVLIGSYLSLIQNQYLSAARAQAWNSALVIAEAGVEEAMAHLNSGVTTNNLAVNSWINVAAGTYQKTNFLGDNYAIVSIKLPPAVTNTSPVIVSKGCVTGPLSRPQVARTVQVNTKPKVALAPPRGMVSLGLINLNGNGVLVDSFDSGNTNYSTGGLYDAKKARDQAQVSTLSSAPNMLLVSNGKVKGLVRTGPGGKPVLGPNGSVGDASWVNSGRSGIQAGHVKDDADFQLPDNSLPKVASWKTPSPTSFKMGGVTYKYVLDASAAWRMPIMDGNVYVNSSNVVLLLTDSFSFDGQLKIPPGSSLSMYVSSPIVNLSGQGIMNGTGKANAFNYYGLPSNNSFSLAANAAFVGWVKAPETDFILGGGGVDTYDFCGACMAKSVTMNGHFNFHYDETLIPTPPPPGYVPISWDEL